MLDNLCHSISLERTNNGSNSILRTRERVSLVVILLLITIASGCREDAGTIQSPTGNNYPRIAVTDTLFEVSLNADFYDTEYSTNLNFEHVLQSCTVSVSNYKTGKVMVTVYSLGGAEMYDQTISKNFFEKKERTLIAIPDKVVIWCSGFTGNLSVIITTE